MKGSYLHGKIDDNYNVHNEEMLHSNDKRCRSYILFLSDVLRARDVLGPQTSNRVILIPRSTQWKLQEFLSSKYSSDIINLLVIGESLSTDSNKVSLFHQNLFACTFKFVANTPRNGHMFYIHINCIPTVWVPICQSCLLRG